MFLAVGLTVLQLFISVQPELSALLERVTTGAVEQPHLATYARPTSAIVEVHCL